MYAVFVGGGDGFRSGGGGIRTRDIPLRGIADDVFTAVSSR
jgi:hypothetical protein